MKQEVFRPKGVILGITSESVNIQIDNRAIIVYREEMTIATLTKLIAGLIKEGDTVTVDHRKGFYSLTKHKE